jgi:UDP-galactopyranose mutase
VKVLVVGAGLSGCVAAERFAAAGHTVTVFEKRDHVAGHAMDYRDRNGAMVHAYGPHLFHTNDLDVVEYLSQFTAWLPHEHKILSSVNGKLVPVPINLVTLRELYGFEFTPEEMRFYLQSVSVVNCDIKTSEDWLLSTYGPELTELFFTHYIRKQWGRSLAELDWTVASRIKPRFSDDCRTFTDQFQGIPKYGYTMMCYEILNRKNIVLITGHSYLHMDSEHYDLTVYTGPVDEFFGHRFGPLPYRSLEFCHSECSDTQAAPTIVYPGAEHRCTRITDWRQVAGAHCDKGDGTSILIEFPTEEGEPMYPVPAAAATELYTKYETLAKSRKDVLFCGRLGLYKYANMDAIIADTLGRVKPWL